jgi:hypothetical protein
MSGQGRKPKRATSAKRGGKAKKAKRIFVKVTTKKKKTRNIKRDIIS